MRRHPSLIATAAALPLVLAAGCGSERPAATKPAGTTLTVTETDFALRPAAAHVQEAGSVRITVVNRGKAPHALAVQTPGGLVRSPTLAAGHSGELEVELDPGTSTWFCPVGDHRARGMEGRVTVAGGGDAQGSRPSFGY